MNKKIIIPIVIVLIVAAAIIVIKNKSITKNNITANNIQNNTIAEAPLKEFSMTSFTDIVDGKYKPQFSLKEITVKKGDRVKIKITVTNGNHDFKIDEFAISANTQINQETVVEFVADKIGEFIYYCSKPGHRQNGHWGTLKVLNQ